MILNQFPPATLGDPEEPGKPPLPNQPGEPGEPTLPDRAPPDPVA